MDALEYMGRQQEFTEDAFDLVFKSFDKNSSGAIDKKEMEEFI